jgi:hypothetical protein
MRRGCTIRARCSATNRTAIPPSPTAGATILVDPDRTSPTANTPGRLVSTKNGARPRVAHRSRSRNSAGSDGPVRINPSSSRAISRANQSVRGAAPISTIITPASMACCKAAALHPRVRLLAASRHGRELSCRCVAASPRKSLPQDGGFLTAGCQNRNHSNACEPSESNHRQSRRRVGVRRVGLWMIANTDVTRISTPKPVPADLLPLFASGTLPLRRLGRHRIHNPSRVNQCRPSVHRYSHA